MALNLYKLHPDPKSVPAHDLHHETIPELVWDKYKHEPEELRKREKALAKDAAVAYRYAATILKGRFRAGEAAIAKDPDFAYYYAHFVLKGPFPAGEAAIAGDADIAQGYASDVLKLPHAEANVWPKKLKKKGLLAGLLALRGAR